MKTFETDDIVEFEPVIKYRIPPEVVGIQVNFCKNPNCPNFGIPSEAHEESGVFKGRGHKPKYTVVGAGKDYPHLRCNECGELFPIKSNLGIREEIDRFWDDITFNPNPDHCLTSDCLNHTQKVSISTPKAYQSFGTTKAGSQRYRCKLCKKFVTIAKATRWQQHPEKNLLLFKLLLNKSPIRRICEVAGVNAATVYNRIDFFYEQCLAFSASHEKKLATLPIDRLYLSVDRQDYAVNWSKRKDKRNTVFQAVSSTDNATQYVFGLQLNYDPRVDSEELINKSIANGDTETSPPFRQFARHWLSVDYIKAIEKSSNRATGTAGLSGSITDAYTNAENRDDVEDDDLLTKDMKLPSDGSQIHSEYTLYGHFYYLKKLLGNVGKFRFFLDQDSGMRAACLAAFCDEIKERKADAFFVSITKNMTVDEKQKAKNRSKRVFKQFKKNHIGKTDDEIRTLMIIEQMNAMEPIGKWKDRWLLHPLPSMSEPEKAICYLTNYQHDRNLAYDREHMASLYNKASLHGVDTIFMQIRRRISLLERSIHSRANAGRVWFGYAPYNPQMIMKLLTMFRTFHNFIDVSEKDNKTPAQRLGLATKHYTYKDVIHFNG